MLDALILLVAAGSLAAAGVTCYRVLTRFGGPHLDVQRATEMLLSPETFLEEPWIARVRMSQFQIGLGMLCLLVLLVRSVS